jgi:hypothetical protein
MKMPGKLKALVKAKVVAGVISTLLSSVKVPGEVLKKSVDGFLDPIEEWYKSTDTKVDDVVYGGLSKVIRNVTNTPDDDDTN